MYSWRQQAWEWCRVTRCPLRQNTADTGSGALEKCFSVFLGSLLATPSRSQLLRLAKLKPGILTLELPKDREKGIFLNSPQTQTGYWMLLDPLHPFLLPGALSVLTCCQSHHTFATHFCAFCRREKWSDLKNELRSKGLISKSTAQIFPP